MLDNRQSIRDKLISSIHLNLLSTDGVDVMDANNIIFNVLCNISIISSTNEEHLDKMIDAHILDMENNRETMQKKLKLYLQSMENEKNANSN